MTRISWSLLIAIAACGYPRPEDVGAGHIAAGRVHGLWDGSTGVALHLVAGDVDATLALPGNGPFHFDRSLSPGASYRVTVTSPPRHTCTVTGGDGTVGDGELPEISVGCTGPIDGIALSGAWGWAFDPTEDAQTFAGSVVVQDVALTIRGGEIATARIDDAAATPGAPTAPIALPLGRTTVPVALTAGELSKTYQLTFDRGGAVVEQVVYGKASNTGAVDNFGSAMAAAGDTLVVAAINEASAATGVNGNQADNSAESAGAVYVFVRSGTTWTQQAYLKASNTEGDDRFGWSLAVDGDTIAVGAPGEDSAAAGVNADQRDNTASFAGAVYVFVRSGTTWTQQAYLKASNPGANDQFGLTVALSGDTIAVGAPGESSPATGVNPTGAAQGDNSAPGAGAAYVFVRSGATWRQQAYVKASNTDAGDIFGFSVALSGDTLAVGALGESSAAAGPNPTGGAQGDNSAQFAGAAYVFVRSGATWAQQAYLKASNPEAHDQFGTTVALSGDTLAVAASNEASGAAGVNGNQLDNSAPEAGAVYVFVRAGAAWTQQAYLKASNTEPGLQFGGALALSGDALAVGAISDTSLSRGVNGRQNDDGAMRVGAAYLFVRGAAGWSQDAYVKASNAGALDYFGASVALAGGTLAVGALTESSGATGINPDAQNDNGTSSAGAMYLFR